MAPARSRFHLDAGGRTSARPGDDVDQAGCFFFVVCLFWLVRASPAHQERVHRRPLPLSPFCFFFSSAPARSEIKLIINTPSLARFLVPYRVVLTVHCSSFLTRTFFGDSCGHGTGFSAQVMISTLSPVIQTGQVWAVF